MRDRAHCRRIASACTSPPRMILAEAIRLHNSRANLFLSRAPEILLTLILLGSFLLKLHHLDHQALKGLDESFHAVVAKNLLKHPLTPTFIDRPFLPSRLGDWQVEHIWLHKPIWPLWQI